MGERTMFSDFSFIWVYKKQPCLISKGGRYIIIFDLEDVVPVWSPAPEDSDEMLGTFEFWNNCFRKRCGVYIADDGRVCVDHVIDFDDFELNREHPVFGHSMFDEDPRRRKTVAQETSKKAGHEVATPARAKRASRQVEAEVEADEPDESGILAAPEETSMEEVLDVPDVPCGQCEKEDDTTWNPWRRHSRRQLEAEKAEEESKDEKRSEKKETERVRARSRSHLLDHGKFCGECPGCLSKARDKKRFHGAFDRNDPKYKCYVTMDQVSMTDLDGTLVGFATG